MGQARITSDAWCGDPADDAAHFYATLVPMTRALLSGAMPAADVGLRGELEAIAFVFPYGGKAHEGWQRAAIQALAREAAPRRVNGVVGDGAAQTDGAIEWLEGAPGVTGQLLAVQAG